VTLGYVDQLAASMDDTKTGLGKRSQRVDKIVARKNEINSRAYARASIFRAGSAKESWKPFGGERNDQCAKVLKSNANVLHLDELIQRPGLGTTRAALEGRVLEFRRHA